VNREVHFLNALKCEKRGQEQPMLDGVNVQVSEFSFIIELPAYNQLHKWILEKWLFDEQLMALQWHGQH
jgi:hypothetical protein